MTSSEGIEINPEEAIKDIDESGYKYLGILEYDNILHGKMKEKIRSEYSRRVRLVLRSQLTSLNSIIAINTWAVPVVRYTAGVINWTKAEIKRMDTKTRKLLTIYRSLHPRSCVDRIYLKREHGGRGLMSIQDTIESEEGALGKYVKDNTDPVLREVWMNGTIRVARDPLEYKRLNNEQRSHNWHNKPMAGQYLRQMENVQTKESWNWLRRGELKRETEETIVAAQDQALRTRYIKNKIERRHDISPKCRLCGSADETINHLISECSKLAQREYKRRHDKVAKAVHWTLCKKHQLEASDKWYQHVPEPILQNEHVKLLWDYSIQTDQEVQARRPDLVLQDKRENITYLIDIAIPYDTRIKDKQVEKIQKYQDLKIQVQRCWDSAVKVIPIVIGALGAQPPELQQYLRTIGCERLHIGTIQKSVLLGTAHIIRKVLGE